MLENFLKSLPSSFASFLYFAKYIFSIHGTILIIDSPNKFIQILSIWHMNQLERFSLRRDLSLFRDSIPFVFKKNLFLIELKIMPNKVQLDKFLWMGNKIEISIEFPASRRLAFFRLDSPCVKNLTEDLNLMLGLFENHLLYR